MWTVPELGYHETTGGTPRIRCKKRILQACNMSQVCTGHHVEPHVSQAPPRHTEVGVPSSCVGTHKPGRHGREGLATLLLAVHAEEETVSFWTPTPRALVDVGSVA